MLSIAAPQADPNAPKPEGSELTPVMGEQLVVSLSYLLTILKLLLLLLLELKCVLSALQCIDTFSEVKG